MQPEQTILVVDDVPDNIKLISAVLQDAGYRTMSAHDGQSALDLAATHPFDMIMLDIMMPGMSGLETCRHLKVDPQTASIPVIFLTAGDAKELLAKAYRVGAVDYIQKPFFKEELLARVKLHLQLQDYQRNLEAKVEQSTRDIAQTQVHLMYMLGGVAEGHSIETHLHVKRVAEFTYLLATLYGMEESEARMLKDASSLHDLGKLGISDKILHKEERLDGRELKEMRKHAHLGAKMLGSTELPLLRMASIVCKQHHEKYDGSGYPEKLSGDQIHIYARIVAIADVFDALLFPRAYKRAWSIDEVVRYLHDNRGSHFDPQLVDLVLEHLDRFLAIYDQERRIQAAAPKAKMGIFTLFKRLLGAS
ncbi:MAG: response regulator [Campylobacterales bacterium]|nr:response regulator [Campylobacterales bacterium]